MSQPLSSTPRGPPTAPCWKQAYMKTPFLSGRRWLAATINLIDRAYTLINALAKFGFQLGVSYLPAKGLEEFCKPPLRKFFHGLAEGPDVITNNQGGYALSMTLVSSLNSAIRRSKAFLRHGFASGFFYDGRDSRSFLHRTRLEF